MLNLGFSGEDSGGVYHSIYDSFTWYSRFGDPDFTYGKALTQVMTTSLMRLADAPILPFEFGAFARAVRGYVAEIEKLACLQGRESSILRGQGQAGACGSGRQAVREGTGPGFAQSLPCSARAADTVERDSVP